MNSYDLSRNFWNWAFDNPEKISPNHAAVYFFAIEHCNRLGWKEKFGLPSQMVMDAIGIKKHSTYIRYFRELIEYKFFDLIQKSSNQYSSNIISLSNALPKKGQALDKAISKHGAKHTANQKEYNKTINKEPKNNKQPTFEEFKTYGLSKEPTLSFQGLKFKYEAWVENGWKNGFDKPIKNWKTSLLNTIPHLEKNSVPSPNKNAFPI